MTTDVAKREEQTTDLVPRKVGEYIVPTNVAELEKLLEATKNNAFPLPFRADILPAPAQRLLYSIGGIPEYIAANHVMLFAGRPYIDADGCIDTAIDQGCDLRTERNIEIVGCLDPQSMCPGEVTKTKWVNGKKAGKETVKATAKDQSYIATARVKKPSGGALTVYGQCCAHTWQGDAKH